jgi:hypothetical protein
MTRKRSKSDNLIPGRKINGRKNKDSHLDGKIFNFDHRDLRYEEI